MPNSPVCVVVGAGPGLGLAVARRFGREGFAVAVINHHEPTLSTVAAALTAAGITACGWLADVAEPTALKQALAEIANAYGPPDVVVYNAIAPRHQTSVLDTDQDALVADFKVNVAGAVTCCRLVVPDMQARGQGTLLLTGGGLALQPVPQFASMSIGKAGLRSLATALAAELEPAGIHVATVTICGLVKSGTHFDPDIIAEEFWRLHAQPRAAWECEMLYR